MPGTRLDVCLTQEERARYRDAVRAGETLSGVVRGLLEAWATERGS